MDYKKQCELLNQQLKSTQEKCYKLEELVKKYKKFKTEIQNVIKTFSNFFNEEVTKLSQKNTALKESLSQKNNIIQGLENLLTKIIFKCDKTCCKNTEDKIIIQQIKNINQTKTSIQDYQNKIIEKNEQINILTQQNKNLLKFINEIKQKTNFDENYNNDEIYEFNNDLKFDIKNILLYNQISKNFQLLDDKIDSIINISNSILKIIQQIYCQPHETQPTWIVEKNDQ